jgi:hypothetical protein
MVVAVRLLAPLLISLLVGLTPVAYFDLPDPLWIAGYWDDDDADTEVDALLDACAIPTELLAGGEPRSRSVVRVELPALNAPSEAVRYAAGPRAPPVVPATAS